MEDPKSILQVVVLPAERGARAAAAGEVAVSPTASSQEPLVSVSCARVNEIQSPPQEGQIFLQKLLFGMMNAFDQSHNAAFFSSHFCGDFNG